MDEQQIIFVNESDSVSILSDIVSFSVLIVCFIANHHLAGGSVVIDILISIIFFFMAHVRGTKKVKRMTSDEAYEYLKIKKGDENVV